MDFNYDDIYGVDIEQYLKIQGTTLEELMHKIEIDIELMNSNLRTVMAKKLPYPESYLETAIYKAVSKKTKHLSRLQEWAANHNHKQPEV